ncbi:MULTISPECIES: hypothetical protein [Vibrio]|uniref:hypothetical protein n=1 Tax=Vibrio TaxID=662 RepID=UPI00128CE294|nr:hypothetical protein [Vibrio sp. VGrn 2]EIK0771238.1 hypothetical protein [Vibrio alginolyticus]EJG0713343.1 hypothetical protein [Vibrio parahaemolyticus]ELB2801763.1 hypothetical protein [Vibrio alginolyticus]ELB2807552.1 hypothetical protein [Vibrio alginolyticus]ELB2845357.1 hypothetical protein [Vibrio alginolyticus]
MSGSTILLEQHKKKAKLSLVLITRIVINTILSHSGVKVMDKVKGIELDRVIEKELILMCDEGFEQSPITQANLFRRLKAKEVINTRSTLTSRKNLIENFAQQQKEAVSGPLGETLKKTASMKRSELEKANARLIERVDESRKMLQQNTKSIINMVKAIRLQTQAKNIERCLSPYLIRELHQQEELDND